jgi:hypothetical protein
VKKKTNEEIEYFVWVHFRLTKKSAARNANRGDLFQALKRADKTARWQGDGCGMGYGDVSVETFSLAGARRMMKAGLAYVIAHDAKPCKSLMPYYVKASDSSERSRIYAVE